MSSDSLRPDPSLCLDSPAQVSDDLVAFLYELMRAHLPVGIVRNMLFFHRGQKKFDDELLRRIAWDMAYKLQNGGGGVVDPKSRIQFLHDRG